MGKGLISAFVQHYICNMTMELLLVLKLTILFIYLIWYFIYIFEESLRRFWNLDFGLLCFVNTAVWRYWMLLLSYLITLRFN